MQKWEVIRIYCDFLADPHDKFCICICPDRNWFMFINSEPPQFRKARALAVSIENFEATFLHHQSFVDTTKLMKDIPVALVEAAIEQADRKHGFLAPSLRTRIKEAVQGHDVMTPDEQTAVLND